MSLSNLDREQKAFVKYLSERLIELKDIVGPLDGDENISEGRLRLSLNGSNLDIIESYGDCGPLTNALEVAYENEFYKAIALMCMIHDIAQSKDRRIDLNQLKQKVDNEMLGKRVNKWLSSAEISNAVRWSYEKFFTFERDVRDTIRSIYPLKGQVDISLSNYSPKDFE
jgi:hypothetical protein